MGAQAKHAVPLFSLYSTQLFLKVNGVELMLIVFFFEFEIFYCGLTKIYKFDKKFQKSI